MTAEPYLLPLPEPGMLHVGEPREWFTADQMHAYARANVAHAAAPLQAEIDALRTRLEDTVRDSTNKIEALRAEVERSERYAEQSERERLWAEARAERLAEALRDAAAALDVAGLSGNAKRFHAALEQENDDA